MNPVDPIIERLKLCYGVTTIGELVTHLGVARSTYDSWKMKRAIPQHQLLRAAEDLGVNLHWLITGEGSRYRTAPQLDPSIIPQQYRRLSVQLSSLFDAVPQEKQQALYERLKEEIKGEL